MCSDLPHFLFQFVLRIANQAIQLKLTVFSLFSLLFNVCLNLISHVTLNGVMFMIMNWKCSEGIGCYKNDSTNATITKTSKYGSQTLLYARNKIIKMKEMLSFGSKFNPLKTKLRLLYLKTQFVPRSKHFSSRL